MTKASTRTVYDGQTYEVGEEIWDLGSFECVGTEGNKRFYSGLSSDAPAKLPKYDNLSTDSTAKCLDNGDFYYYHAPSKTWYKQQSFSNIVNECKNQIDQTLVGGAS